MSQTTTTTSAGVHWDLTPLFGDSDAARAAIPSLLEGARAFRERYRGRVAELEARGASPELTRAPLLSFAEAMAVGGWTNFASGPVRPAGDAPSPQKLILRADVLSNPDVL